MIIDISKHNGDIDFSKVKSQIEAIIIRLGYRGYSKGTIAYDPKFSEYVKGCQDNGIPYSVYFFPCSVSDAEAEEEADFIINAVKDLKLCLPIFLDSEVAAPNKNGRSDNLSREDRTRFLRIIVNKILAAGYQCGVYASTSWLNNNLDMSQLQDCATWVAQYANACTYGGNYEMWQYTSKGSVYGVSGNVDCSENRTLIVNNPAPVVSQPVAVPANNNTIEVDGVWGVDTTTLAQKVFKTMQHPDGLISNQREKSKEYLLKISEKSWQFSTTGCSKTIKAIQEWAGLVGKAVDGLCGKDTITAMQNKLNSIGYNVGNADGKMGSNTVKGFQRFLNDNC